MKKNSLLFILLLLGCDNRNGPTNPRGTFLETITVEMELVNRIELSDYSWQTIRTIGGTLIPENEEVSVENFRITWESDMFWLIDDTAGYFRLLCRNCRNGVWWGNDGSRDTIEYDFNIMVPVTNQVSISNAEGQFWNVLAPVRSMVDRSMTLWWSVNGTLVDSQSIFLME